MDVDQTFALFFFFFFLSQANISTSTLSWNCGEHCDFIAGRILHHFSFEISMTNSDLFDLTVAGLLPISWMSLISIAHGLNFLLTSGSILHLESVGYD